MYLRASTGQSVDRVDGVNVYWDSEAGVFYIYTRPHGQGRVEFENEHEAKSWIRENLSTAPVLHTYKVRFLCSEDYNGVPQYTSEVIHAENRKSAFQIAEKLKRARRYLEVLEIWEEDDTPIQAAVELPPKAARQIGTAPWGHDAVDVALNYLSDKLDGYDGYGDSFDVSYQGTASQLTRELAEVLKSAGLTLKSVRSGRIVYDNEGSEVHISIHKLPEGMDYTFTENSTGYSIYVEEMM